MLEITRLKNTRIGNPVYELDKLVEKHPVIKYNYITGNYEKNRDLMEIIFDLVIDEYNAVKKLIKEKEDKINDL